MSRPAPGPDATDQDVLVRMFSLEEVTRDRPDGDFVAFVWDDSLNGDGFGIEYKMPRREWEERGRPVRFYMRSSDNPALVGWNTATEPATPT